MLFCHPIILLILVGVELPLRVVVTILECCVTFSGVQLSIRSFILLLPTWLNRKTLKNCFGYGPKTFRTAQGREKFFGPLVGESGGMLPQRILKISVLRLAENVFATF